MKTLTPQEFESVCDNIFEANNNYDPSRKNLPPKKISLVEGEPGTKTRIQAYADKIARGETLFE